MRSSLSTIAWEYSRWYKDLCENPPTRLGDAREVLREVVAFCVWMNDILPGDIDTHAKTMAEMRAAIETKHSPAEVSLDVLTDVEQVLRNSVLCDAFDDKEAKRLDEMNEWIFRGRRGVQ